MTNDHDLLITIANDVKHMREWTGDHTELDEARHKENLLKFDKIDDSVEKFEQFKWQSTGIIVGAVFVINVLLKFFGK